jgi:hypothetical protein
MALRKSFQMTNEFGQTSTLSNCYCKVNSIDGGKDSMGITVAILASDQSQMLKKKRYTFSPDLDGDNFIRQAYLHLKTLDDFANAEDV